MTKLPRRQRAQTTLALVLLCALDERAAAQRPAWTPPPQPPQPPQPPSWPAPPLRGPFAALVPDTLARSLTCRTADPLPEDSLRSARTPRMVCSAALWAPARSEPRSAYAILEANGEVKLLLLSWMVYPARGEDSVRTVAIDSAHEALRVALVRRLGPGTWCNDRLGKPAFVWKSADGAVALHPHRRNAPRQGGPLRGYSTMPGFGTLLLSAQRGSFPDCAKR
jgi:hypothetical protein